MSEKRLIKLSEILTWFFVVFMFILELLIISGVVGTLPVHASESSYSQKYTLTWTHTVSTWQYPETRLCVYSSDAPFVIVRQESNVKGVYVYFVKAFIQNSKYPDGILVNLNDSLISGKFDWDVFYTKDNVTTEFHNQTSQLWTSHTTRKDVYSDGNISESTVEADFPIFDTNDHALAYCQTGSIEGLLNGDSVFPSDESYTYTGFTMNGKTASWTGTTQRSNLLDQDVEEYTTFTYGFASSEDQTVSSFIEYAGEYATADKKLKLPWDEMEANKKVGEFIRQVNIVPSYRVPGAFYHGIAAKVYFHEDGSIDKVELPFANGTLSSDMERPIIVLNEASNGKNPLEADYSYFRFNNSQDDYFIEMKGRWYSTNDFDLYKENLVWKYKYQTILKNDLSTWVSIADNVNSVGSFKFDVLGKSSWENLLSLYPVDDRNFEGGSVSLVNKITGYNDALDTLKMLLKQPYSLYNGYEVYVRYYRYAEDGSIQYSKWTHFYNNLANAGGSSGSRLDDLDNMYSESQSEKGLTDDELSDLENTGNSRNDTDAVQKNNYDYSSLENATMSFFDMLKNYGSMLGQFPSMVASVFSFLPSWLIAFIGFAIGAVIVCRFIGR